MNGLINSKTYDQFVKLHKENPQIKTIIEGTIGGSIDDDTIKDNLSVDRELKKLLWADIIIYITPIMWFNMPAPMVKWLSEVLLYKDTFIITEEYGEWGQVPAEKFMIVTTSNMKSSDLWKGEVLKNASHIDDLMQPLIMTNNYLSIRKQIPTFHAGDVIAWDTSWIESAFIKHLDEKF